MVHSGENIVDGVPVEVERKRVRRISIRVKSDGRVAVSVPKWGATLAEAVGLLTRLPAGKNAVFSHAESVLISEEAAELVIPETLDFISRSNELRLGTRLFIVRGDTAAGLIEKCGGELGDLLSLLGENSPYLGVYAFTAGECSAALKRNGACLIECVKYDESVVPCGFAAISGGAPALFLDGRASEGAAQSFS